MKDIERILSLELVRVTEAAALACGKWMGLGKKNEADNAATEAMRIAFDSIDMQGKVVIGEGEMDDAPMLYIGEELGTSQGPFIDIAVDPLEGTTLLSKGLPNALSVVAIAEKNGLLNAPDMYMDKIAVGPKCVGKVHLDATLEENLKAVASANNKSINDVVVTLLDRERHQHIIRKIREIGARIKLISDGDVSVAINTCFETTDTDIMLGSGGAPEGVLAAVAIKCLGGDFQGRLIPENQEQVDRCVKMGISDPNKLLQLKDIVRCEDAIFAATGITNGDLLNGVIYRKETAKTNSVMMRAKTGTVRLIHGTHKLEKNAWRQF